MTQECLSWKLPQHLTGEGKELSLTHEHRRKETVSYCCGWVGKLREQNLQPLGVLSCSSPEKPNRAGADVGCGGFLLVTPHNSTESTYFFFSQIKITVPAYCIL